MLVLETRFIYYEINYCINLLFSFLLARGQILKIVSKNISKNRLWRDLFIIYYATKVVTRQTTQKKILFLINIFFSGRAT